MTDFIESLTSAHHTGTDPSKSQDLSIIRALADEAPETLNFIETIVPLSTQPINFIGLCKPPKVPVISSDIPYDPLTLSSLYKSKGISALCFFTEDSSLQDMRDVKNETGLPILRWDYITEEYQIYESKAYGADSFVLMANLLDLITLQLLVEVGRELRMEAVILCNDSESLKKALSTDVKILLINNISETNQKIFKENPLRKLQQERLVICHPENNLHKLDYHLNYGFKTFIIDHSIITNLPTT